MGQMTKLLYVMLLGGSLSACHDVSTVEENELQVKNDLMVNSQEQGISLKKMVTQPGGIYSEMHNVVELSNEGKKLVGRYYVRMTCDEPLALCTKGSADFIVNLLDDGRLRRTIIYLGNVSPIDDRQYREDKWTYDDETKTIIIELLEGPKMYVRVLPNKSLMIDRHRTLHASEENYKFFIENGLPLSDYEFKRLD
jgi:hypothetical protein